MAWYNLAPGDHSLKWGMSPGGYCWDYYPGTVSCSQVAAAHLKTGRVPGLQRNYSDLNLKIGYQYSSSGNGHQEYIPY